MTVRRKRRLKDLKIEEGSLVERGANPLARVVFHKNDSNIPPPMSDREMVWGELLAEFDAWQEAYGTAQHKIRMAGGQYRHRTREELLTEFLATAKGRRLYQQYQAADTTEPPAMKKQAEPPKTLEEYSWRKLERIAKAYQAKKGGTIESAHLACMTDSLAYRETYHLGYCSPLSQVDFTTQVSKSVSDAISFTKVEIDAVAVSN